MNDMRTILDIGNGYIKGVIFGLEQDKTVILAKEIVKTRGMRKGKILDIEDFAVCINEILESFERKLGGDFVEEVFLTISHPHTEIKRVSEQKRVLNKQIGPDDIQHLSDVVADVIGRPNYEVLKIIPVQWILDDQTKMKDPLRLEAKKLELIADVIMIPRTFYTNLLEACNKLDIQVVDIFPNVLGASEVCLDHDLKDIGVLLVDIGTNQTSYVVYEEGFPVFYGTIPVGGEEVTKDISIGLQVDIKDAEQIKREKGAILMGGETRDDDHIDTSFLSDIMLARYEEIFELIQENLQEHNKDGRLPGGVILIGGATKVENLGLLAKDVFKLATFTGEDKVLRLGDISTNAQFINLLGAYVWIDKYFNPKRKVFNFSMKFGLLERMSELFKQLF